MSGAIFDEHFCIINSDEQFPMILVDTHVVVWLALEPARISKKARAAIEEARRSAQGLGISDMSLLEIAVIESKGRIKLNASLETFLSEVEARFVVLPITGRVCVRAMGFPAAYPKDPADRIIGATALVEGVPLLTADVDIQRSKALRTIW
jgi:PIN domain nuclease of toxin-antitoxin system